MDHIQKTKNELSREKVFRDPVHDYVHVRDSIILDLINSREFQRLRRIKQLGTSSYTFHGAEHTRFNHSLGVYELTRRIINNFVRNYPTQEPGDGLWDDSERMVALCAALLHDIGHGPFSHTFEGIFNTNHEAITQEIITSPTTEVNQILASFDPDLPLKVAQVINKTYANQQVVQLISSQIDADRMDYLLRDAYYAGVSYGQYDLTRILRVIRPYDNKIIFDFSGMHAVEDYIVSRYQMYMQVYFHPVSRGMEEILQNLFQRAKYCYSHKADQMKFSINFLVPFLNDTWTLDDYLKLDDHLMSAYFTQWLEENDPILKDLAYRFLNRHPFKSLLVSQEDRDELMTALQKELVAKGYDPEYYLGENSSYDLPYDYFQPYKTNSQKSPIELITKNNQVVELSQVSAIVKSLAGRERGDYRLYFPREVLHAIQAADPASHDANQAKILQAHLEESNDVTYHIQQRLF
ncbi:HD domain-containing protein [Eremococcus coleocola]|uniref:HD domain protein n=1 Tax=Eremococcus coleocola ACS-139-V-Col8 TaxID=908337 RepID=E4KQZ7_9LACT|nr:HD domain-containing protein [Eremococcus coleocola]EFR30710.1 HD domain protein [Eremococcus coleocola ACS-139-V-Col8]